MSDEPRHVALERQLAAEGWKRCPEDDTAPGSPLAPERAWEHEHPDIWVSVPIDPEHEWYDANCDEVLVAMARASGETWASTLREVERLRAIHETATAWSDDSLRADARRAITVGRAVTLETQTLEEMTVDLVAEVERLRGELAEATKSAAMACELPCGDCAGCRFADDVMRELPATTYKEPGDGAELTITKPGDAAEEADHRERVEEALAIVLRSGFTVVARNRFGGAGPCSSAGPRRGDACAFGPMSVQPWVVKESVSPEEAARRLFERVTLLTDHEEADHGADGALAASNRNERKRR